MTERRRRTLLVFAVSAIIAAAVSFSNFESRQSQSQQQTPSRVQGVSSDQLAANALSKVAIKGRAPKTGYSRQQFSDNWGTVGNCDLRNLILRRDMKNVKIDIETNCKVISGILNDPYTGETIIFARGAGTSSKVQIDHVVAVSDAWQKGAQQLSAEKRYSFYNDPLNLLAVKGSANQAKGDGDAATWLPPNKAYRCRYVARQIAVKIKYTLWVTPAEHDIIKRVLQSCSNQVLPIVAP